MLKQYRKPLAKTFRLLDLSIILLSFCFAYSIRFGSGSLDVRGLPIQYYVFVIIYLVAWIYFSTYYQLYVSKRLSSFPNEAWDVTMTTALCLLVAMLPPFFIRDYPLSRLFLVYLWPLQTGTLIVIRLVLREILKSIRRQGYNFRHVLFVGQNERAAKIAMKIQEIPESGFRILGFIDAPNNNNRDDSYDYNFIGYLPDLERILRKQVVDEVFVTLPIKSFYAEIEGIVALCEQLGIEVIIPTDLFIHKLAKTTIYNYADVQVVNFYTSPRMNWQFAAKRLIDVVISAVLLAALSPLFAVLSILIKATSKGPVIFRQRRVGYNGRPFTCLKFRTMVENAEEIKKELWSINEMDGPTFKIRHDPRVTKLGRFLRRTSIDELPQLVNVLRGEMSLVGPRPPIPGEVEQYKLQDRRRLSMKPGLTCLWQVSGRNAISFDKWMELDKDYIDRWSLWLDVQILAKTIPAVLKGSGEA